MEDLLMIFVVIIFFILGSVVIRRIDVEKHEIWIDHNILIIHNDSLNDEIFKYANATTVAEDELLYRYDYIFVDTLDDYNNLLNIYNIKKNNLKCEIYSVCHDYEMKNLYLKENIKLFDKKDLYQLVKGIYEQSH